MKRALFGSSPRREVEDELAFHIEERVRELTARGMAEDEARRRVLARLGDVDAQRRELLDLTRQRHRSRSRRLWLDELRQDASYAVRVLRRSPLFSATAVLVLALSLGANTAIFSVVRGVLLESLPFADAGSLVAVSTRYRDGTRTMMSGPDYASIGEANQTMVSLGAYRPPFRSTFIVAGEPLLARATQVSRGFFGTLGSRVALGRLLRAEDHLMGSERVVLVSHGFWQSRLGASGDAVGQRIGSVGGEATIVGVLAPDAEFPAETDVYSPVMYTNDLFDPRSVRARRGESFLMVARLRERASMETAAAELGQIATRLQAEFPTTNDGVTFEVEPLAEATFGDVRTPLLVLLGAVGLMLLVACANLANLLLTRATVRGGEIAVRAVLGASRGRMVRQFLVESIVLSSLGGLGGLALAWFGTRALIRARPIDLPRIASIAIDGKVVAFGLGLTLVTGVVFGLMPAIQATGRTLAARLRAAGRSGGGDRHGSVLRGALIAIELAVAVVLTAGAGLLLRTFQQLTALDPGFSTDRAVSFNVRATTPVGWSDNTTLNFYDRFLTDLRQLPGVEHAGAVTNLPVRFEAPSFSVRIAGEPADPARPLSFLVRNATVGYFAAMGARLLAGRDFTADDTRSTSSVAVINRAAAERWFRGRNPIGLRVQRLFPGSRDSPGTPFDSAWTIVGVVDDMLQTRPGEAPLPELFVAFTQEPRIVMSVVVRSAGDPMLLAPQLRALVRSHTPASAFELVSLEDVLHRSVARPRFFATMLALFAITGLVLVASGIFGVMSYIGEQRQREISVRMALGARSRDVIWLVSRTVLLPALAGLTAGTAAAVLFGRALQPQLYGVTALDPLTFGAVLLLLSACAGAATLWPARRAARTQPAAALRDG